MYGNVITITAPAAEPIALSVAKAQCDIDDGLTDWDVAVQSLIKAARSHVESVTNRRLVTQVLRASMPALPCRIDLHSPARKVASVTYLDDAGASQTLASADYVVDLADLPANITRAYAATWPCTYEHPAAVTVNYTAGYATPFTVNTTSNVVTAVGHPYANGDVVPLSNTGGDLPGGLTAGTVYYAVGVSGNDLQLSLTEGGSAVDITSAGTGTHFLGEVPPELIQAMLTMVRHWFDRKGAVSDYQAYEVPMGAKMLMSPYKVWGV